jgi:putative flippase GtrA
VLLTFLVLVCGLYLLHFHYLLALITAFLVGIVFNYVLNFVWVLSPENDFPFCNLFIKHLLPNVGIFSINLAALYLLLNHRGESFPLPSGGYSHGSKRDFIIAKYSTFRR